MKVLIVTPLHNEESNLEDLRRSVRSQTFRDFDWVLVDDGSTDRTGEIAAEFRSTGDATVVTKINDGGLIGGSAYTSWRYGVHRAPSPLDAYSHVMKLDADVRLPPSYLSRVLAVFSENSDAGIAGGRIATAGMREQLVHVPGPVKLYSLGAFRATEILPSAIGFDVMDEIAAAQHGMQTVVLRDLTFRLSRAIGASEGGLHGRYRNGRVCRWTGYDPAYFVAHVIRYIFRKPYIGGAFAMVFGYVRAGDGPYPAELRKSHRALQRAKLKFAVRSPFRFLRETY